MTNKQTNRQTNRHRTNPDKMMRFFRFAIALMVAETFFATTLNAQLPIHTKDDILTQSNNETDLTLETSSKSNPKLSAAARLLLDQWSGPYGGVPPWRSVDPTAFESAFEVAMDLETEEVEAIAGNPEMASFENTILALERSGKALRRLSSIYSVHTSNLNVGPMADIEAAIEPKLAKHSDSITQNAKLFARIKQVYDSFPSEGAVEQKRLVEKIYKEFVRQGAELDETQKLKLSTLNVELSGLFTQFNQNVLAAEEKTIEIFDRSQLAGLPASIVGGLAVGDDSNGNDSNGDDSNGLKWVVTNTRSAMEPVLTYAKNRDLREKVWRAYYGRCDDGGEHDNNEIITTILKLRAQRAELLGYATHAHWRLEPQMAGTPENAMRLMESIWPKAVARVAEEVAAMQAVADSENADIKIEPWDYRYYAEKVRKAKYDLDFNEVKPYLQLEKLREGMMWSAGEVFGLAFKEVDNVPVFHPDVRVWEVSRDDQFVGLWYFDPFARTGKHSGAWMTSYRKQSNMGDRVHPLVSNNSNFLKSQSDEPTLISWDDAETLFHEFGHALHGLCSDCKYPSQSGTSVARDFVEFPSQIYESWLSTPELLEKYAVHCETGEPLPAELLEKIQNAATFNQGFATVEYLASALVDMKLHLAGNVPIDPDAFEKKTLADLGMPGEIVMRHRTPHFSHIFSSDAYSAGYYSYVWAEALTADAAEAFEEAGSFYDPKTSKRLEETIFSIGDTVPPEQAFEDFRGRKLDPQALFRKRGFPVEGK